MNQNGWRIWTYVYTPFIMGGDVYQPVATLEQPLAEMTVDGITVAVFQNPRTGKFHVAEKESGGLVGHGTTATEALSATLKDLASADPAVVAQQIAEFTLKGRAAEVVEPEEFWVKFRK